MKLRNKLLPLISVATLATAITPMAASCTPAEAKLTGISVNTDYAMTTYVYGEDFNTSGLEVIATYDDNTQKQVALSDCEFFINDEPINKIANWITEDSVITIKYLGKQTQYTVKAYEDILNYQYREEALEAEEGAQLTPNEAFEYYWDETKVEGGRDQIIKNLKDDVFYNVGAWAEIAQGALKLEESGLLSGTLQTWLTQFLKEVLGDQLSFVGVIKAAGGKIDNLTFTPDLTNHKVRVSCDITLYLRSKMIDRDTTTEPTTVTETGAYYLTTTHHLENIPYTMGYWSDGLVIRNDCFGTMLPSDEDLKKDDKWSITRSYYGIGVTFDGDVDDGYEFDTVFNNKNPISAAQRNFFTFHTNYLENFGCKTGK